MSAQTQGEGRKLAGFALCLEQNHVAELSGQALSSGGRSQEDGGGK